MSAKNIMITDLKPQFTADYIANVLWKREIAKVSSITLIPQINNDIISNIAYIEIDMYCETEAAYDFVRHMFADFFIFCHDESDLENTDNFWILEKNTHNSGNLRIGSYTTAFAPEFFKYDIVEAGSEFVDINPNFDDESGYYSCDSEEWEEFNRNRPIKGLDNVYYTIEEALQHLWVVNEDLDSDLPEEERLKLEAEMDHLENELKKWQDTVGYDLSKQAEELGKTISMGEICPALFVPRSHKIKREVAGEWYNDNSWMNSRREVAMSVDEYNASQFN